MSNIDHVYPYFSCSKEAFDNMTMGMTTRGKGQLANMMAHHCIPLRRDENGWMMSRYDLAMSNKILHVSNDGDLNWDYKANKEIICWPSKKNMPINSEDN